MDVGEMLELQVERLVTGGDGLARQDGTTVFIPRTAPGDQVRVRITETRKGYCRAQVEKLIKASAERIEPACPHFNECGGCTWLHLPMETQRNAKREIVEDLFRRALGDHVIPAPAWIDSPLELGYRNRMQFHRTAGKALRESRVGLMHPDGRTVTPISSCPVADLGIQRALADKSLVPPPASDRFTVYAHGSTFLAEGLRERGTTQIHGRDLALDARLFFQSNARALEPLVDALLELARSSGTSARLLDLYCGVGTFASFLAPLFSGTDMVELSKESIALCKENVRGENLRFFAQSDDEWTVRNESQRYGMVVVDPPRTGLSARMRTWLAASRQPLLCYVSCDPATLARDSAALAAAAYHLESLSIFDFYPQTAHIESLAVFRSLP